MPPRKSSAKGKQKATDDPVNTPASQATSLPMTDVSEVPSDAPGSSKKALGKRRKSEKEEVKPSTTEQFQIKAPEQWERAEKELQNLASEGRKAGQDEIERAAEISNWLIGFARPKRAREPASAGRAAHRQVSRGLCERWQKRPRVPDLHHAVA
ncbi:hypothetical protein CTheo_9111 [Ceratobasidium theobromae]|uniref:Uncharacterized protein n=1 Tax=Ceratobasidium theobromae TaxID=1582974 RepID=A0A5N5Q7N8_9AGAM|nr:hypothetical protein CTheo_9111 [Ceratobasidium theobromae]